MASRGVNKVILIGNCGADPEARFLPAGGQVTNVRLATSESWKDKNSGQMQERTEWHRVVFFNRLAEIASEYLRKGSKVYIEGAIRTRKWQDKEGKDQYTTEIVAAEMQMLDSRGAGSGGGGGGGDGEYERYPESRSQQPSRAKGGDAAPVQEMDAIEDDIPF